MPASPDLQGSLLAAWATSSGTTAYLIAHLPERVWPLTPPGVSRRSIRAIAAHLHNARCSWIKTLGQEHGIRAPAHVNHRTVSRAQLLRALPSSSRGIGSLLRLGWAEGGRLPTSKRYVWRNLPLDVGHVLAYFVAHEAHHRGQLVLGMRLLGVRLPRDVEAGLWQWRTREREGRPRVAGGPRSPRRTANARPFG